MKVYIIFIYILTFRLHILGILCMWTTHKNYFNSLKLNFLLFYKTKIQFIKKSLLYSFYLSLPRPSLISFPYFLISTLLSFSESHFKFILSNNVEDKRHRSFSHRSCLFILFNFFGLNSQLQLWKVFFLFNFNEYLILIE